MGVSILKKLRETAAMCPNGPTRAALQDHANALVVVMRKLEHTLTDAHLRELNGLWVRAYVMMDAAQKPAEPTPPSTVTLQLEKAA